jgi:hypothetical protein
MVVEQGQTLGKMGDVVLGDEVLDDEVYGQND